MHRARRRAAPGRQRPQHARLGSLSARLSAGTIAYVIPRRFLGRTLHRPVVFAVPPFALRLLIGPGADELLLWGQRVLPARLLAAGFTFTHPDLDGALQSLLAAR
ncbi:MAG: DUF1731 domain-containing protein [Dehalococcoidia bacterium]|nr:MAG: DUF1731 domain-containing protein [Dehalococcoidia bacterium]